MGTLLTLWIVKGLKIAALSLVTALTSLATHVAPATDWVTERLSSHGQCHSIVLETDHALRADPQALFATVPQRGAERAIVLAISPTTVAASPSAISFKCSIVSDGECIRLEADPST